jgi:hypothetical protein
MNKRAISDAISLQDYLEFTVMRFSHREHENPDILTAIDKRNKLK